MSKQETILIINPGSGKKKVNSLIQEFSSKTQNKLEYDLLISESEEHLREIAKSSFNRYDNILLAGGDTTFTIVINSILKDLQNQGRELSDLKELLLKRTFGILAQGSANDISKELNTQKVDDMIDAVIHKKIKKMDLGLLDTGQDLVYFLGSVSCGLGVLVNHYLEHFKKKYPRLSKNLFFRNTLMGVYYIYKSFSRNEVPKSFTIQHQEKSRKGNFVLLVFMNCKTYAGGLTFFDDSSLFNGYLSCIMIASRTFFQTLRLIPAILRKKTYKRKEITRIGDKSFRLISKGPMMLQYDGELVQGGKEVKVSILEDILPVFKK